LAASSITGGKTPLVPDSGFEMTAAVADEAPPTRSANAIAAKLDPLENFVNGVAGIAVDLSVRAMANPSVVKSCEDYLLLLRLRYEMRMRQFLHAPHLRTPSRSSLNNGLVSDRIKGMLALRTPNSSPLYTGSQGSALMQVMVFGAIIAALSLYFSMRSVNFKKNMIRFHDKSEIVNDRNLLKYDLSVRPMPPPGS
jgi:hypothetical protein